MIFSSSVWVIHYQMFCLSILTLSDEIFTSVLIRCFASPYLLVSSLTVWVGLVKSLSGGQIGRGLNLIQLIFSSKVVFYGILLLTVLLIAFGMASLFPSPLLSLPPSPEIPVVASAPLEVNPNQQPRHDDIIHWWFEPCWLFLNMLAWVSVCCFGQNHCRILPSMAHPEVTLWGR